MSNKLLKTEILSVVMLSLALSIRQMSMTIVAPFISTYCRTLTGYTPLCAGIALGIFGLTQAVFQIPYGILSDKYGNKKIMILGITQVVVGLVIAHFAENIYILIFARALQGSGAIIGVGYSWIAGMVDESKRSTALSILGGFVSAAAAIAFALGPVLISIMSVSNMFIVCAILLLINEIYLIFFLKDSKKVSEPKLKEGEYARMLLKNKTYVIMNLTAFINNFMMMSVFYAAPMYIEKIVGETGMWKIFVPAVICAVLFMKAAVKSAGKHHGSQVLSFCFAISSLSLLFYFNSSSFVCMLIGTVMFLCGYVSITTISATNVNYVTDDSSRGMANGIFNSFQYIGNFIGPAITGALWEISDKMAWTAVILAGIIGMFIIVFNMSRENV